MSGRSWFGSEHEPLHALVAGLDALGDVPIPYARLPTRVRTAFGAEFLTWSQIAGETIPSLMTRRQAGEATVAALMTAAAVAVSRHRGESAERLGVVDATRRLLDEIGDRDQVLLLGCSWGPRVQTRARVADELGTNSTWVDRHLARALARFDELMDEGFHQEVSEWAGVIRRRLGPYASIETVADELRSLGVEDTSAAGRMLLHLAGPYTPAQGWLEVPGGQQRAEAAVAQVFGRTRAPLASEAHEALSQLGLAPSSVAAYFHDHPGVRRLGDRIVVWGNAAVERAEAVLHAWGKPATVDEVHAAIGEVGVLVPTLRDLMSNSDAFIRTSRYGWGLRDWGGEEYAGIAEAIGTRIDKAGGSARAADVLDDVVASFPDVSASSVSTYTRSPAFVIEAATIRRRGSHDPWPRANPLNRVRGAFRHGRNRIRLAYPVNGDLLRGSGRAIAAAAAAALGVRPNGRREFTGPQGSVRVMWSMGSQAPAVGSLRELATSVSAHHGDTLVVVFDVEAGAVEAVRVPADASGAERLQLHLGRHRVTAAALAAGLSCSRADVEIVLRRRGDIGLAVPAAEVLSLA